MSLPPLTDSPETWGWIPPQAAVQAGVHQSPAERDDFLTGVIQALGKLPGGTRQTIADALWSTLPTWVDEYAYNPALANGGTLAIGTPGATAVTGQVERIEAVVAYVPTGATGLLNLGQRFMPLPAGLSNLTRLSVVLGPSDTRSVTITGASGATSLWLAGQIAPSASVIGNE